MSPIPNCLSSQGEPSTTEITGASLHLLFLHQDGYSFDFLLELGGTWNAQPNITHAAERIIRPTEITTLPMRVFHVISPLHVQLGITQG